MSVKDVNSFFEEVERDKSLQAKLRTLQKKLAKTNADESAAGVVKIAAAAGFKVTAKDVALARKAKAGKRPRTEMPEVAGQYDCPMGVGNGPFNYWY